MKSSQSLTSNGARIGRPFVASEPVSAVKENVAHKVQGYTNTILLRRKDNAYPQRTQRKPEKKVISPQ